MKKFLTLKNVLIGIGLIVFDLVVYSFLGMMLMGYDDFIRKVKENIGAWKV